MKLPALFFAVLLALGLAGCESTAMSEAASEANKQAIADGAPFRWQVRDGKLVRFMLPLPSARTRADVGLQQDVLARISATEQAAYRPAARLADIKRLPDGREVWVLQTEGSEGVAYILVMRPNARGGLDLGLSEAITYVK